MRFLKFLPLFFIITLRLSAQTYSSLEIIVKNETHNFSFCGFNSNEQEKGIFAILMCLKLSFVLKLF